MKTKLLLMASGLAVALMFGPMGCATGYNRTLAGAAIGTVAGDVHDIGKNIVISMLEGNGFKVMDVGIDIEPQKFVDVVRDNDLQILGLSALLTSTMPMLEETIVALKEAGLRKKVKVMIGGAPITQAYADQVGADGYGADAVAAVEIARALIGKD